MRELKLFIAAVLIGVWENIDIFLFLPALCSYLVVLGFVWMIKNPEEARRFFEE
ncbi:hypothetical protein KQH87_06290 [Ligilactobacillus animalis]|uniref:hypothetical protein n=1 Tax=Ligilactobacillus animalis TaxID=1605 RepID=UPI001C10E0B4|nr:hypothetical protein [Ligilactobacillus animalis]MBU5279476.1 hypothetical protein [Ligilactobacillus animalis]